MLIYIHGFNSSPASFKAALLRDAMTRLGRGDEFLAPALSHWPERAVETLRNAVETHLPESSVTLVGSSLGGFYATYLAEQFGLKAVLVNPAVRPYSLLHAYLGPQKNFYTGEEYVLTPAHIEQLKVLEVEPITRPDRYFPLVQTGDEVLDYRLALEKYSGSPQLIVEGGDHGFQHFSDYVDDVLAFVG